jgi:hypothetical protein
MYWRRRNCVICIIWDPDGNLPNLCLRLLLLRHLPASISVNHISRLNGKTQEMRINQLPSEQERSKYTASFLAVRNLMENGWKTTLTRVMKMYNPNSVLANERVFSSVFVTQNSENIIVNSQFDTSETSENGVAIITDRKRRPSHYSRLMNYLGSGTACNHYSSPENLKFNAQERLLSSFFPFLMADYWTNSSVKTSVIFLSHHRIPFRRRPGLHYSLNRTSRRIQRKYFS